MFLLGKLLGVIAVQRTLSDTSVFQQFLVGTARLILLSVLTAFMVGILLVGGFYAIHMALVSYGLTADAACIVVACVAALITIMLILFIQAQLHKLQNTLQRLLRQQAPIASRATEIVEAFVQGLMTPTPTKKD